MAHPDSQSSSQRHFLIRKNCEYTIMVDAPTAEEALEKASHIEFKCWDEAWAPDEAEEVTTDGTPVDP